MSPFQVGFFVMFLSVLNRAPVPRPRHAVHPEVRPGGLPRHRLLRQGEDRAVPREEAKEEERRRGRDHRTPVGKGGKREHEYDISFSSLFLYRVMKVLGDTDYVDI